MTRSKRPLNETLVLPETPDTPAKPGKRFVMPAVVLGLLGGHVTFVVLAITFATGDRSFAVVPDYYQKAVDFDEHKAALEASDKLGWQIGLEPSAEADVYGNRVLVLRLTDAQGQPVRKAAVRVSCYHLADAGRSMEIELVESLPGQYVGSARVSREGFYQFDVSAIRGEERYVQGFEQFLRSAEEVR